MEVDLVRLMQALGGRTPQPDLLRRLAAGDVGGPIDLRELPSGWPED
ncbi:MAG: hypothetical protein ACRDJ4_15500 [Actinomycetota bacterium]